MDKKSSTQLSACAEEISRTKTAKGLKVRIEVQHIERVIQTFCISISFSRSTLYWKNFKNYGAQSSHTNIFSKALKQGRKTNPNPNNWPMK